MTSSGGARQRASRSSRRVPPHILSCLVTYLSSSAALPRRRLHVLCSSSQADLNRGACRARTRCRTLPDLGTACSPAPTKPRQPGCHDLPEVTWTAVGSWIDDRCPEVFPCRWPQRSDMQCRLIHAMTTPHVHRHVDGTMARWFDGFNLLHEAPVAELGRRAHVAFPTRWQEGMPAYMHA